MRVLPRLPSSWRVMALTSQPERRELLRRAGARPLVGDLDDPASLGRLGGLADLLLHLAPPPGQGGRDTRSIHLLRALARGGTVRRVVYVSTTGVYGDHGGAWVDETTPPAARTARAQRRLHAEALWRWWGRRAGVGVTVLRVPGIYSLDRPGGDPRERVRRGSPVLRAEDDVFTNHIHADDLARACVAALHRGLPQRLVNVCDDTALPMGDYLDRVADRFGLPRPPRLSREAAAAQLSPQSMSFLSESRRVRSERLARELRLRLDYPTVDDGLAAGG